MARVSAPKHWHSARNGLRTPKTTVQNTHRDKPFPWNANDHRLLYLSSKSELCIYIYIYQFSNRFFFICESIICAFIFFCTLFDARITEFIGK